MLMRCWSLARSLERYPRDPAQTVRDKCVGLLFDPCVTCVSAGPPWGGSYLKPPNRADCARA